MISAQMFVFPMIVFCLPCYGMAGISPKPLLGFFLNSFKNLKMTFVCSFVKWCVHTTTSTVILRLLILFKKNPQSGFGEMPLHKTANIIHIKVF